MDKVCAVFGGSRGIGRAVAQLMAQKGYRLAIVARNLEVAKAAAGELGGRYRKQCGRGASPRVRSVRTPDRSSLMTVSSVRLPPTPGRSPGALRSSHRPTASTDIESRLARASGPDQTEKSEVRRVRLPGRNS